MTPRFHKGDFEETGGDCPKGSRGKHFFFFCCCWKRRTKERIEGVDGFGCQKSHPKEVSFFVVGGYNRDIFLNFFVIS